MLSLKRMGLVVTTSFTLVLSMAIQTTHAAVTLSSPVDDHTVINLSEQSFTWQPVSGASIYRILLSTDANFSAFDEATRKCDCVSDHKCFTDTVVNASSYTFDSFKLEPNTEYFWKVRGNHHNAAWSGVWSFTTDRGLVTDLVSPADNYVFPPYTNQTDKTFAWTSVLGASVYRLAISTYSDFANLNDNGTTAQCSSTTAMQSCFTGTSSANSLTLNDYVFQPNTTYYWKVRANSSYGEWSDVRSFTTENNTVANLLIPADSSASVPLTDQTFYWNAVNGATVYRLALSTDSAFSDLSSHGTQCMGNSVALKDCFTDTTGTNSIQLNSFELKSDTQYFWKIRANAAGSVWSEIASFTTAQEDLGVGRLIESAQSQRIVIRANYPAAGEVLANISQVLVLNQSVQLNVEIYPNGVLPSDQALPNYSEVHTVTTDADGVASFEIGSGTVTQGTFAGLFNTPDGYYAQVKYGGNLINVTSIILPEAYLVITSNHQDCDDPMNAIDDIAIQDKIDALSLAGGGRLIFAAGQYCLDDSIYLPNNIHLVGAGKDKTVLGIYDGGSSTCQTEDIGPFITGDNQRAGSSSEYNVNITIGKLLIDRNTKQRFSLPDGCLHQDFLVSLVGFNNDFDDFDYGAGKQAYTPNELEMPSFLIYDAELRNNSGAAAVFGNSRHVSVLNSTFYGYTKDKQSGSDIVNCGDIITAHYDHGNLIMFGTSTSHFKAIGNIVKEAGDTGIIAYSASYGDIIDNQAFDNRVSGINSYNTGAIFRPHNQMNASNTHIAIIRNNIDKSIFDGIRIENGGESSFEHINRHIEIRNNIVTRSGFANPKYDKTSTRKSCSSCGQAINIFGSGALDINPEDNLSPVGYINIENNTLSDNYAGIAAGTYNGSTTQYSDVKIVNNDITGNSVGIVFSNIKNSPVENNLMGCSRRCEPPYEIVLRNHTEYVEIKSNTITGINGSEHAVKEELQSNNYSPPYSNEITGNCITGYVDDFEPYSGSGSSENNPPCVPEPSPCGNITPACE